MRDFYPGDSTGLSRKALYTIAGLLTRGRSSVCYLEEYISRTGQLGESKRSIELAAA